MKKAKLVSVPGGWMIDLSAWGVADDNIYPTEEAACRANGIDPYYRSRPSLSRFDRVEECADCGSIIGLDDSGCSRCCREEDCCEDGLLHPCDQMGSGPTYRAF